MLQSMRLVSSAAVRSSRRVVVEGKIPLKLSSRATRSQQLIRQRWFSSEAPSTASASTWYTWGTDHKGSLLQPDQPKLDTPAVATVIDLPNADSITQIVCGATDTAIVLENGDCYVCGENKSGQLGVGHRHPVESPTLLEMPLDQTGQPAQVAQIALGSTFSAIIDTHGDLYTFGYGGSTLGDGLGFLGHGYPDNEAYALTPKLVESLVEDGCFAKKVQVGKSHMTVLTTEGEVLTCGAGSYGRLGNLETHQDQLYLEAVEMLRSGVTDISGGKSFTAALKDDGVIYTWGRGDKGQLGTGFGLAVDMYAMAAVPEPIEADELLGRKVIQIAAGCEHAVCITEGGEVFQWGMTLHLEPVRVSELLHTKIVQVAAGDNYSIALDEHGQLYTWGQGKTGVLAQGGVTKLNQAALVEALEDKKVISNISAGWQHVACQTTDTTTKDK
ncbi:RCC1 and BTB domain-containing protein 2 [Seminavis robusta]|uniref:RCC1 and BTB domain-containing protein 2 n=1 Tax=Seminavis robusta TaxID=568900 RepID=A0A9N8HGZ4_9STRA|nr:RCC1 and BTB domain-containing protein 2 [Seminavis robusta]|eukprot:Sro670_g184710.1 RCC1 and BTB domain-containing protein 2 (443) ;mRNA; f:36094-37422